jgi:hypothetical protein
VGSCRIYLEPLAFQCEAVADAKLLSSDGKPLDTTLRVELLPWEETQVSKCCILNNILNALTKPWEKMQVREYYILKTFEISEENLWSVKYYGISN